MNDLIKKQFQFNLLINRHINGVFRLVKLLILLILLFSAPDSPIFLTDFLELCSQLIQASKLNQIFLPIFFTSKTLYFNFL